MSTRPAHPAAERIRRILALAAIAAACSDSDTTAPDDAAMQRVHRHAHNVQTCSASAPGPSSCPGVSVSFSPYAPGDHFGADFQSAGGSGASSTITITFSQRVSSVTVTAFDPTFAGNQMQAFDENGGMVGTVAIAGSGVPGVNIPQTVTLSGSIRSIRLIPGANDYVAYGGLTFTLVGNCPTNDGVLDNPAIRQALKDALTASGAFNSDPAARRENAGWIYQRPDGTYDVRTTSPSPTNPATPCSSTPGGPQPQAGETVVAPFHTHPFSDGDILPGVDGCGRDRRLTYAYDSDRGGGGSPEDWEFIKTPLGDRYLPMYIIDKEEVFRLDPNTSQRDRRRNPNRFRWTNPSCPW